MKSKDREGKLPAFSELAKRGLTILRAKGFWPQEKPPFTEDQRQFELNRLLSRLTNPLGFDNIDVWLIAIETISDRRKKAPYLQYRERDEILGTYGLLAASNIPNVPVSELVPAEIADLGKHPLLSRICFNYDGILGSEESPDLLPLQMWGQVEFSSLLNIIRYDFHTEEVERFDQFTQTPRRGVSVRYALGDRNTYLNRTLTQIIRLLKPNEVIKPVKSDEPYFPSHSQIPPTIVQRYTSYSPIYASTGSINIGNNI